MSRRSDQEYVFPPGTYAFQLGPVPAWSVPILCTFAPSPSWAAESLRTHLTLKTASRPVSLPHVP